MHGMQVFKYYENIKYVYPDIDSWDHESIEAELTNTVNSADLIYAVSLCENTLYPWEQLLVFQKICLLLNDRNVFFDVKQDISVKEIAYAVTCLKKRYPDHLFNDEVSAYIATEALEEGFVVLPHILSFSQRFIPNIFISSDQEVVQQAYLNEVENYATLLNSNITAEVNG